MSCISKCFPLHISGLSNARLFLLVHCERLETCSRHYSMYLMAKTYGFILCSVKDTGYDLEMLLNSFMPHYPPIYKIYLQRVLAPFKGFSCASVPRRNTENGCHCCTVGDFRLDGIKLRFRLVIPTNTFFIFNGSVYPPHN